MQFTLNKQNKLQKMLHVKADIHLQTMQLPLLGMLKITQKIVLTWMLKMCEFIKQRPGKFHAY